VRTTGRILLIAGLAGLAGCEGGGPLTARTTQMGSLKASVSQLEFQNDELQRQVSSLKSENRRFEDRLVQERAENERLASQLDGAKERLGESPGDVRTGSRSDLDDDEIPPPRARRSKSTRKPPAAQIPGQIRPALPVDDDDLGSADPDSTRGRVVSRRAIDDRWLPVARGIGAGDATVK
jgi:hypothetical protein